tara:strand:- start:416 stop:595 length:180 start_codon:yes stop_codon:yes gene_type:complete
MSKSIDDLMREDAQSRDLYSETFKAYQHRLKRERADRFVMHTCIVLISFVIGFIIGVAI